jgi:hypothetical protein
MNARAWVLSVSIVAIASSFSMAARADAVEPPPDNCPAGSNPGSSHSGPLCSPRPVCLNDLMCESGDACEPVRLCVVQRACGGLRPPDAGPCFIDHAVGVCGADGSCSEGSCLIRDACVVPGSTSGGCSCSLASLSTASRGSSGLALLTTLSLFGLVLGRRMRYLARR